MDDFAVEEFGLEFGVELPLLYLCDFVQMGLVVEFAFFIEEVIGAEL